MGFHFQSKGFTLSLHLMFLQIHPMESRDEGYKILLMKFFLPGTQNIFQKQKRSSSSSVSRTSWRPPPSCPGCLPGPPARIHRIRPRAWPACSRTLSAAPPPLHAASTLCKILNWCSHWPCSCHLWDLITWNRRHWSLYSNNIFTSTCKELHQNLRLSPAHSQLSAHWEHSWSSLSKFPPLFCCSLPTKSFWSLFYCLSKCHISVRNCIIYSMLSIV